MPTWIDLLPPNQGSSRTFEPENFFTTSYARTRTCEGWLRCKHFRTKSFGVSILNEGRLNALDKCEQLDQRMRALASRSQQAGGGEWQWRMPRGNLSSLC